MFMIVTYPWPVASAHVELTGPQRLDSAEIGQRDAAEVTIEQRARHLEATVGWTDLERARFHWYRLRIAIDDLRRRKFMTTTGLPATKD
jgi:hypothetical protein